MVLNAAASNSPSSKSVRAPRIQCDGLLLTYYRPTEVLLVVLLRTFTFSLSDEIYWNLGGVQYPSAGRDTDEASMTLRVGLVDKA